MTNSLYSVFGRGSEFVGIGEFGQERPVIRVSGGVILQTTSVQLHDLGPLIAGLNRDGYSRINSGTFFDERSAAFTRRNSDFASNNYQVFVRVNEDAQTAVQQIEKIGLVKLEGEQRKVFNEWLRSLDLSQTYFVAPSTDPVLTLTLSEYAFEKSLVIFSAKQGLPNLPPSAARQAWIDWLSKSFNELDVVNAYNALWPSKAIIQTTHGVAGSLGDIMSLFQLG